MPAYIKDSSIANPKTRRIIEHAIIGALGERDGDWFISIKEGHLSDWQVEIIGPNNFFWKRTFFGVREQDDRGEYVAMTVRDAVH
jgi:hypothetical protein